MVGRILRFSLLLFISFCFIVNKGLAQIADSTSKKSDTTKVSKPKGAIGRFAQSLSEDLPITSTPIKTVNPFLKDSGKTIHDIEVVGLGFDRNINDTTQIKRAFGMRLAKVLHRNTRTAILYSNLFFKQGEKVYPYLLADNERYLRDLTYIQDARIVLKPVVGDSNSVDVLVLTKDVFSIGGSADASGINRFGFGVLEDNLEGKGDRVSINTLYDKARSPKSGYGIEYISRNIKHSFIDWTLGATTYASTFNTGENELFSIYSHFDKPLISPYIPWIGALDLSINRTANNYNDSIYTSDIKYRTLNMDGWFGYNFGSKKLKYKNEQTRLRKFVVIREFNQFFIKAPGRYDTVYNSNYANITGFLGAINIFKQTLYTTNFIYGFGRGEDVPEGFNASIIAGWSSRSDTGAFATTSRRRAYYGLDFQYSHLTPSKGFYSNYTFRIGGNQFRNHFEDADILFNVDHFTKLSHINKTWLNRNFFSVGFTRQISPVLNAPLYLQSQFGLPYFPGKLDTVDMRTTFKFETVFFNIKKHLGFRFAPFAFLDMSLVTPQSQPTNKSDLFPALGGGVRTRNENLTFGTLELKGYYFPRPMPGEKGWKIEFNTNIRFKYNSSYIHKPDFISPN